MGIHKLNFYREIEVKLFIKIMAILAAVFILVACGGGGGSSGSSGGGGNNSNVVLPNGSVVTAAQSSITSFTGGTTTNTISISGGTAMPVTVNTNAQVQTFNIEENGKLLSDSGIKVTTNPSPLVLISGGSQSSGQIVIDAAKASPGNYIVNVYGAFTNPSTGQPDSMVIAQFSVIITPPTPSDLVPGELSITPSIVNLNESNGKTSTILVSLDGSQNVNNLSVSVSSDNSGVTLSNSECVLSSSSNTCQITLNGSSSTTELAEISAQASKYNSAHSIVHINNPQPIIVYGSIGIEPTSISIFPNESSSFTITWSGSQNLSELPLLISESNNIVTLNKDSCLLTPINNSCTINVTGTSVGTTNLTIQVSNSELAPHYPVQHVAVEVNQQAYGSLSLTPSTQAVYIGESGNLYLSWSDSHGVNTLPVSVTSDSSDIQLNTSSCNLTPQDNSCTISFSGKHNGSATITVIPSNPAQASHFSPQLANVQVQEVLHNQLLVAMIGVNSNETRSSISLINSKDQVLSGNVTGSIAFNIYGVTGDNLILYNNYFNSDSQIYRGNSTTNVWRRLGRNKIFTRNTSKTSVIAINKTSEKIVVPIKDDIGIKYGLYSYVESSNDWQLIPGTYDSIVSNASQSMVFRESDLFVLVNSASPSVHYVAKLTNGQGNWESIALPTNNYFSTDAIFVDKQNNLYYTTISAYGNNAGPVVYRLDQNSTSWTKLTGDGPDGSLSLNYTAYIQYLTSDSQGNIYVTVFEQNSKESVFKFLANTQQWQRYGYQSVEYYPSSDLKIGVPTIAIDNNDIPYLTFAKGIYKIPAANDWNIIINGDKMGSIVMSPDGLMNFNGAVKYGWPDLNKQTSATDWSSSSIRLLGPQGKITNQRNSVYVSSFGQKYLLGSSMISEQPLYFTLARWDGTDNNWQDKQYQMPDLYTTATAMAVTNSGLTYLGIAGTYYGASTPLLLSLPSWSAPFTVLPKLAADQIKLMTSDTCGNTYLVTYTNDGHAGIYGSYQINSAGEILPMSSISTMDSSKVNTLTTDYACNVYVGTENGGIYRHNSTSPLSNWQLVLGIPNTVIKKIIFNHNNQMYLETFVYVDPSPKIATYSNSQISYLPLPETKGNITDFAITYDGSLYAGTDTGNVWLYDFVNNQWVYTKYGNGFGTSVQLSAN